MNNDELLAMYLDGTLSEGERTDFDRLLNTSPTFAQEVREILTIQDMLLVPSGSDERTAAFLQSVENNLADTIIAAGAVTAVSAIAIAAGKSALASGVATSTVVGTAAGTSAAATSVGATSWTSALLSTAFASTTSMVVSAGIGVATLVGGAATVNYLVKKNTNVPAASEQSAARQATEQTAPLTAAPSQSNNALNLESQTLAPESVPQAIPQETAPQASTANHTSPDITAQRQADVQSGTSAPRGNSASQAQATAPTNDGKPREYTARISGGGAQIRTTAAISDYTKQLQAKTAANDRTGAAFVEKSLGVLLGQSGQLRESRLHLGSAAKAAHELGLQELEGEALAETALLDAAEGKKERAAQGLHVALGLLSASKSSTIARWQKELDKLTSK